MKETGSACDGGSSGQNVCPTCQNRSAGVPTVTLYHHLKPDRSHDVNDETTYGVCRERTCHVLYFSSDQSQTWDADDVRTVVGFKQPEDKPPHPVCYCFGFTEENITREIEETGQSTAVEWITERVQNDDCACEYQNPTGRCCLGDVRDIVDQ